MFENLPNFNLFSNVNTNYTYLKNDFLGITFNFSSFLIFFFQVCFVFILFLLFYLCGDKITRIFIKNKQQDPYWFFVTICLGYIAFGTGIAFLGVVSLLKPPILFGYYALFVLFSIFPYKKVNIVASLAKTKRFFSQLVKLHTLVFIGTMLFVGIALLRVLPPEIGEDAVGYHTDLPVLYLSHQTMILPSKEPQRVIPVPQLGEMPYLAAISFGLKDASRLIHFVFYCLVVLLLFTIVKQKKNGFFIYVPLLFVTSSVVLRHASTAYVDFNLLLCWLLTIMLLQDNKSFSKKKAVLIGILFGGVLATKVWLLIYIPVLIIFIIFLQKDTKKIKIFQYVTLFLLCALAVSSIWYIRSYIITGNPIYPILSSYMPFEVYHEVALSINNYITLNWKMFSVATLVVFSPLFFLGVISFFLNFRKIIKKINTSTLFFFIFLITIEQLFINIHLGRHLLPWYIFAIFVASYGISYFFLQNKAILYKYFFSSAYCVLLFYYLVNSLFILPYGLGLANQNNYLTRILSKDNSSYYNFDNVFGKWLNKNATVATYDIFGYYYADFQYTDVHYIFEKKHQSFSLLKKGGISLLFIKGGEIDWFCKRLYLRDCSSSQVTLLATYPQNYRYYNLYRVR